MSVQLIGWAYEQTCGSGIEKTVLVALANRANHDTGECFPLLQRVSEETEFGYSTVKKAVASLVEKGFIERSRRRRDDGSYAGYYYDFPHVRLSQSLPGLPQSSGTRATTEPSVTGSRRSLTGVLAATPRNGLTANRNSRPSNPIWDALTEVFGDATTETARSRRGKVCRSLLAAKATPDEILRRARSWPRHFDDATLTELALEKHWDVLGRKPLRVTR